MAASALNFYGNSTLQATSNVSGTSALSGGNTAARTFNAPGGCVCFLFPTTPNTFETHCQNKFIHDS